MSQRIGIVDLGSNTTRLVIYEYERGRYYRLADEVREVVRLREGMGNTRVLRAAAMARSLNALRMFRALCDAMEVQQVVVAATSAVREAANSTSLTGRIEASTGWTLRVLSGEEEGYYGALGAINSTGLRDGFVVDLGGGSVQIVEVRQGVIGATVSLPLGALRLSELILGVERIRQERVDRLLTFVREQLASLDWFRMQPGDSLVAIGGTIRNLAQIDQARKGFPLDTVHGYEFQTGDVHAISDQLWRLSLRKRTAVPGLRYDRADIIHAGALVYSVLLHHSGFPALTISRPGLREGLFFEHYLAGQPLLLIEDLRRFSVQNVARIFERNDAHSRHVAHLALRMFDDLATVHRLDPSYRELLWAASLLHDIGTAIDYQYHHLHSSYIVLNHTLPGYSPRELALVALLCRYHRSKGTPKPGALGSLLTAEDARALEVLAGIIRLAEYLERGRHQVIRDLRCHLDVEHGWMQIETLVTGDAAMELWDASRNIDVLGHALGLEVELVEGFWTGEAAAPDQA